MTLTKLRCLIYNRLCFSVYVIGFIMLFSSSLDKLLLNFRFYITWLFVLRFLVCYCFEIKLRIHFILSMSITDSGQSNRQWYQQAVASLECWWISKLTNYGKNTDDDSICKFYCNSLISRILELVFITTKN